MKYSKARKTVKTGPEAKGAKGLFTLMRSKGWYITKLHGGPYQSGLPDAYCYHHIHGHRWVETKAPKGKLRASQVKKFGELTDAGDKVFVLEDYTHYERLFREHNWMGYIRI